MPTLPALHRLLLHGFAARLCLKHSAHGSLLLECSAEWTLQEALVPAMEAPALAEMAPCGWHSAADQPEARFGLQGPAHSWHAAAEAPPPRPTPHPLLQPQLQSCPRHCSHGFWTWCLPRSRPCWSQRAGGKRRWRLQAGGGALVSRGAAPRCPLPSLCLRLFSYLHPHL